MMKFVRDSKGFTLVEVIVVAVIVMILAAVAIPLYQGYVRDTRKAVLESHAGAIVNLAGVAVQTSGTLIVTGNVIRLADADFGEGAQVTLPDGICVSVADGAVTVKDKHGTKADAAATATGITVQFADAGNALTATLGTGCP